MKRFVAILAALVFALTAGRALAAPVYIVVDAGSGAVVSYNGSDKLWPPASVTKLMTAYLAFKAIRAGQLALTSAVTVSENALAEPPSKMGFRVGTVMNLDNALKMMIVKSANDIAVAIAETVGGSEPKFIAMMNAEARRLGMASTNFANPNGLPDAGNYTTARDLAVLSRAIWVEFPEHRELFRIPAIKTGRKILRSQNTLLERYRGANGLKTGFVCASGFNMAASATRNGRTLIAVVLGARSSAERGELAAKALDRGFNAFLGGGRQPLANFQAARTPGPPANIRDEVCGKRRPPVDGEEDTVLAGMSAGSSLGPRVVTMEPVVVYTGRTDMGPAPGAAAAAPKAAGAKVVNVPLPRLRPRVPLATQ